MGKRISAVCVVAFALLTVSCACFTSSASAYTLTGQHMSGQLWYTASAEFQTDTKSGFREAMGHWNDILPEYRRLCFDWTPHYDTIYPCRDFKNQIYKTPAAADNLGENRWWYNTSTNEITESDININENQNWWNNPPDDGYYDPRSVMFHEMGHSVGLNHSQYSSAVMYYALSPGITKWDLTTDDINGAAAAYQ